MEFKVRELSEQEPKSVQEAEAEIVENNEPIAEGVDNQEVEGESESNNAEQEINEEVVLKYIKSKYDKDVSSVDDLFATPEPAKPEIPEDVAAFLEYRNKTGRGFEDYVKLNKDYSKVDDDSLLKDYLLATGEAVDEEDLEVLMEDYSIDEDLEDEKSIKRKKLAKKKAVLKARDYFEELKENYRKPVESAGVSIPDEDKEAFEAYKQYVQKAATQEEEVKRKRDFFLKRSDEVFSDFKGFDFSVGDEKITFNPGNAEDIKKANLDSSNFIKKFLNEDGLLQDVEGYHRALYIAMNPDKFAKFFYDQGKADGTDNLSRKIKNIDMSARTTGSATPKGGVSVKAINPSSSRGLKIKSKK